jgi:hypothetical protein
MMWKWANFREISLRENLRFRESFRFPGSFRENGYVSAINIFKMINSNGNLIILVHIHYCCPICFEAPSGFDNFEVYGGQYRCQICFEAPSGFNNFGMHVHWTVQLFDLFWSTIRSRHIEKCMSITVVRFVSRNFRENTKTKIFVSTLMSNPNQAMDY